jgi:hypothetical protein
MPNGDTREVQIIDAVAPREVILECHAVLGARQTGRLHRPRSTATPRRDHPLPGGTHLAHEVPPHDAGQQGGGLPAPHDERAGNKYVKYSVVLPKDREAAYELIGAGEPDVQLLGDVTEHDSRKTYTWYAEKVPEYTWIGIRLQLK